MVERPLSEPEVPGAIPRISKVKDIEALNYPQNKKTNQIKPLFYRKKNLTSVYRKHNDKISTLVLEQD